MKKNKNNVSKKLEKIYYIPNSKKNNQIQFNNIYDEDKFAEIPKRKKENFNFIKFSYTSPCSKKELNISRKWKDDVEEYNTFGEWEESKNSRYQILESRIKDISEDIKKGFFNFQFLTIYSKKARRYFPLPAKLIWFDKKNIPMNMKFIN